jgi:hypothetical protein
MPIAVASTLVAADAGPIATGRSLVPLGPQMDAGHGISRPSAVFLAQLIGTAQGMPQTRLRRRLGAADASACYRAVARQATTVAGRTRGSL